MAEEIPVEQVKRGQHILIKGRPCLVTKAATMSMGMHGVRKTILSGVDVLTGQTVDDVMAGGAVKMVNVSEATDELSSVSGGSATLTGRGSTPFASENVASQASELLKQAQEKVIAVVVTVNDKSAVISVQGA